MCQSTVALVIEALVAAGTIAVAILAIWGEWFRSRLAPPKLTIRPHTLQGDPTRTSEGKPVMYYHLKVVNQRPWLAVTNCRVLLMGLSRRGPDGLFHSVPMAVPLQFVWAPAETTPTVITLVKEHILDFGLLMKDGTRFVPALYSYSNNFQGYIHANEAVRFHVGIDATNFASSRYQVFEVAWDGSWSYVPSEMSQHLRFREVPPDELVKG